MVNLQVDYEEALVNLEDMVKVIELPLSRIVYDELYGTTLSKSYKLYTLQQVSVRLNEDYFVILDLNSNTKFCL